MATRLVLLLLVLEGLGSRKLSHWYVPKNGKIVVVDSFEDILTTRLWCKLAPPNGTKYDPQWNLTGGAPGPGLGVFATSVFREHGKKGMGLARIHHHTDSHHRWKSHTRTDLGHTGSRPTHLRACKKHQQIIVSARIQKENRIQNRGKDAVEKNILSKQKKSLLIIRFAVVYRMFFYLSTMVRFVATTS